jgi:hypothetical protein
LVQRCKAAGVRENAEEGSEVIYIRLDKLSERILIPYCSRQRTPRLVRAGTLCRENRTAHTPSRTHAPAHVCLHARLWARNETIGGLRVKPPDLMFIGDIRDVCP